MTMRVEHEIHTRRLGRNVGVGILLLAFVGIVFGLTLVKVKQLGEVSAFQGYDHVVQPALTYIAEDEAAAKAAAEAAAAEGAAVEGTAVEAAQ